MHHSLEPVAAIIGTWRGPGTASYPTIASYQYEDELVFADHGWPFLFFSQLSTIGGKPTHTETGYFRLPQPRTLEVMFALPFGQAEAGSGSCTVAEDGAVTLTSDCPVLCTPSATAVRRIVRRYHLHQDTLCYEVLMEAVQQELAIHLVANLTRVR